MQAVADAAHGLDHAGVVAELAPEAAHRDVDDIAAALPRITPHVVQQP